MSRSESVRILRDYHALTKHHPNRYAPGPESPDWESQPSPFRHYAGSPTIELPLDARRYERASAPTVDAITPALPTLSALGALLQLSLAITAWKRSGRQQWSVRANPSSGNLHPVEGYIAAAGFPDVAPGLYHYNALDHSLELRAEFPAQKGDPFLFVGLSTLHWRETWKYGARAYRYCALDTGHAAGAIAFAASVLGWRAGRTPMPSDELDSLLGLDRTAENTLPEEREHSEILLEIDLRASEAGPKPDQARSLFELPVVRWQGAASPITNGAVRDWPLLVEAFRLSTFGATEASVSGAAALNGKAPHGGGERNSPPVNLILRRRSALCFDSDGPPLPCADLYRILRATIPDARSPWGSIVTTTRVHFAVFVQRVEGLRAGIYFLPRSSTFAYSGVLSPHRLPPDSDPQCPHYLPLRMLAPFESGDLQHLTRELFCRQEIARESAFALAMLGEFDAALAEDGGSGYRLLHLEAGILGQALYLESEASGLQGTGVGCFFDDAVHEALGIRDTRLQSIYHFCAGRPLPDTRIKTDAPYPKRRSENKGA